MYESSCLHFIDLSFNRFSPVKQDSGKPFLSKLSISECMEECTDPDKIFSENFSGNSYRLNFGLLTNCCGKDTLSFKLKGDTLKIKIMAKPKYGFKIVDGYAYKIRLRSDDCECECYFIYDLEIKDLPYQPKVIKVDRKLLRAN